MSDEQTETEQKMDVVVESGIQETNEETNKSDNDDHDDDDSNSNSDATSSGNIVAKNDATSQSSSSDNDCILVGKEEAIHSGTINLITQGDPSTPKQNGSNVSSKTSNSRSKSKLTVEQKAERAKKQAEERVNLI